MNFVYLNFISKKFMLIKIGYAILFMFFTTFLKNYKIKLQKKRFHIQSTQLLFPPGNGNERDT
jgi:hypothetical protein